MTNPRFLDLAKRLRNDSLPVEKKDPSPQGGQVINPFSGLTFQARFLDGDFGKQVFNEYSLRVAGGYGKNNPVLGKFSFDGCVKGSNPYMAVLMDKILEKYGMHVATPKDVDEVIQRNLLDLRNCYEDMAFVLYSESDPNSYLSQNLVRQIGKNNIQFPSFIPWNGLELTLDSNAPNGLGFKVKDKSFVVPALELAKANNGKKFSKTDEYGRPEFDINGNRTFYSEDSGLRVLIRYWDQDLGAGGRGLVSSGADGRVIAVSGEATTQKNSGGLK